MQALGENRCGCQNAMKPSETASIIGRNFVNFTLLSEKHLAFVEQLQNSGCAPFGNCSATPGALRAFYAPRPTHSRFCKLLPTVHSRVDCENGSLLRRDPDCDLGLRIDSRWTDPV
jgi:hypothetical protein